MQESQNIEWKETWKDDYIKWICGFANAEGGIIFIGKNDNGNAIGKFTFNGQPIFKRTKSE